MQTPPIRIAVIAEHTRSFTRGLLVGIGAAVRERPEWNLEIIDPASFNTCRLASYDAFIARILTPGDARRLKATGKPVIDIFGKDDVPEFPCAEPASRTQPYDGGRCLPQHAWILRAEGHRRSAP